MLGILQQANGKRAERHLRRELERKKSPLDRPSLSRQSPCPHLMRRQALQNLPVAEWQREQSVLPAGKARRGGWHDVNISSDEDNSCFSVPGVMKNINNMHTNSRVFAIWSLWLCLTDAILLRITRLAAGTIRLPTQLLLTAEVAADADTAVVQAAPALAGTAHLRERGGSRSQRTDIDLPLMQSRPNLGWSSAVLLDLDLMSDLPAHLLDLLLHCGVRSITSGLAAATLAVYKGGGERVRRDSEFSKGGLPPLGGEQRRGHAGISKLLTSSPPLTLTRICRSPSCLHATVRPAPTQ